jgi:hypothetical protein
VTTARFPSVEWFRALAARMEAEPEKYRRLGSVDLTLVPRIVFPDGRAETYALRFAGARCTAVEAPRDLAAVEGPHPVLVEGEYAAWREMVENVRAHGGADLQHTLNYLTLPDWPFRLEALDPEAGQLDVDRFYRYAATLQAFFDEGIAVETQFVEAPAAA